MKYFTYCPDSGFDYHETAEAAKNDAANRIQDYLDDTWCEDVQHVLWGEIKEIATQCDVVRREDLTHEEAEEAGFNLHWWDIYCNYKLKSID